MLEAAIQTRNATLQKTLGAVVDAYFAAGTARAQLDERTEDESIAQETQASAQQRRLA